VKMVAARVSSHRDPCGQADVSPKTKNIARDKTPDRWVRTPKAREGIVSECLKAGKHVVYAILDFHPEDSPWHSVYLQFRRLHATPCNTLGVKIRRGRHARRAERILDGR